MCYELLVFALIGMLLHGEQYLPGPIHRIAYACDLDKGFAGPSGEKYILAEDIPAGHIEPDTPMPPASVTTPGGDGDGESTWRTTVYDWQWDIAKSVWVSWQGVQVYPRLTLR